jgi:hypothetical protein
MHAWLPVGQMTELAFGISIAIVTLEHEPNSSNRYPIALGDANPVNRLTSRTPGLAEEESPGARIR